MVDREICIPPRHSTQSLYMNCDVHINAHHKDID